MTSTRRLSPTEREQAAFVRGVMFALDGEFRTEDGDGNPYAIRIGRENGTCYVIDGDGTRFTPLTSRDAAALFWQLTFGEY